MTSAPFNGISCVPASAAFAVHGYQARDEFLSTFHLHEIPNRHRGSTSRFLRILGRDACGIAP